MSLSPRLLAITDRTRAGADDWWRAIETVCAQARPGSVLIVLRDPELGVRRKLDWGRSLRALTRRHGQGLSVSERLDLALLLEADAVHLGEASVSPGDARRFAAEHDAHWWVSRACHDPARLRDEEADAALLSPIFEARKGLPPRGVAGLVRACEARAARAASLSTCRLYALGGVDGANAEAALQAGADGVAAIGAVLAEPHRLVRAAGIAR